MRILTFIMIFSEEVWKGVEKSTTWLLWLVTVKSSNPKSAFCWVKMKTFKVKLLLITVGNMGIGTDVNHSRYIIAIFRTQAKRKLGIIENFIILITVGHCLKKNPQKVLRLWIFFYIHLMLKQFRQQWIMRLTRHFFDKSEFLATVGTNIFFIIMT